MHFTTIMGPVCCLALLGLAMPVVCLAEAESTAPKVGEGPVATASPKPQASGDRGDLPADLTTAKDVFADAPGNNDSRFAYGQLLYEAGDFEASRKIVAPLLDCAEPTVDAVMLGARLAYMVGDYAESERLFKMALSLDADNVRAATGLVFTYYQTNRFDRCTELPEALREKMQLPHMDMMMAFGNEEPYRVTWAKDRRVTVPFLMTDPLPIVNVEINGRKIAALIDTGGDTFILDNEIADSLSIEIVASMMGMFAGGMEAEVGFAKAKTLTIGDVTLHSVPLSVLPTKQFTLGEHVIGGILGTSVLRQFLSTLDYPNERLILRERSDEGAAAFGAEVRGRIEDEIPFYLQSTHFLLAHGSLNGRDGLLFHVDSGLAGEPAFSAPEQTLDYVGIPIPEVAVDENVVGGGGGGFALGTFAIEKLGLGGLVQTELVGSFGAMPPESYRRLGFIQDGLISHNFLRQYAWTIDFSRMKMVFAR